MLFDPILSGKESWSAVFQSTEAFSPLANAIFRKEGLDFSPLSNLTPGTNAVFQSGDRVIKIYAPLESGFDGAAEFAAEKAAMRHAERMSIAAPKIFAAGVMTDRYTFPYLIMELVRGGQDAGPVLKKMAEGEKSDFAWQVANTLSALHQPAQDPLPPTVDPIKSAARMRRKLPASLVQELTALADEAMALSPVLCHGDLTGENVLFTDGGFRIIDWADSRMAPPVYELPPLVFELLQADPAAVSAFFGEVAPNEALRLTLLGCSIHPFTGEILQGWCRRSGMDLAEIDNLEKLTNELKKRVFCKK